MLDYHHLRTEIKASLVGLYQQIDIATDPIVWAWIVHALSLEKPTNNPLIGQALDHARQWLDSPDAWSVDGNLGAVGLLSSVLRRFGGIGFAPYLSNLDDRVQRLLAKDINKFSRLNDPDFVFPVALGLDTQGSENTRTKLRDHSGRNGQPGNSRRAILFAAATQEIGGTTPQFDFNIPELKIHEIFPALWFAARYPNSIRDELVRRGLWQSFESIRESVNLSLISNGQETLYPASPIDVAMLYEALLNQTMNIDPAVLFNNIPLHPVIRQAAESLFIKAEYVMAVFQASVTFVDAVKKNAGYPSDKNQNPLDGGPLMEHVFLSKPPKLKFNNLSSQAEKDEQRGLGLIAQGVVSAVRNPKGHTPKIAIVLDPYEALEQLATISYLMKRLDMAHK